MPELPEVESTRRDLEPRVVGRTIVDVWVADGTPQPQAPLTAEQFRAAVAGRRIERLDRRGKYLIAALSGDLFLILHRRMTGNLVWRGDPPHHPPSLQGGGSDSSDETRAESASPEFDELSRREPEGRRRRRRVAEESARRPILSADGADLSQSSVYASSSAVPPDALAESSEGDGRPRSDAPSPLALPPTSAIEPPPVSSPDPLSPKGEGLGERFLRAVITLDDGSCLHWDDQRRFGTWTLTTDIDTDLRQLGPEPLDSSWSPQNLSEAVSSRSAPIKAVLLDQRRIAGLGNIYADESLHVAGIHPLRPAGSLDPAEVDRLHAAVRAVLEKAIRLQGSSMLNYRGGLGQRGTMQDEWRVYDRAGQPCYGCGTTIVKLRAAGRGTHVCPTCQPDGAMGNRQ